MNKNLFKNVFVFIAICISIITITGCCSSETFVIKEINLEMVKCPAGSFMMGSPEQEHAKVKEFVGGFYKVFFKFEYNEKLHLVTFTKPFYIGRYEVTQSQYVALMGKNPSKFIGANNPVEMVYYDEAKAFCDNLNLKYLNILPQGYKFALPTEAQWEYACRAGTNTALNNGKNLTTSDGACPNLDEVAWFDKNASGTTHIVGQKKPNAWGIYDIHGNVSEWCKDLYGPYPNENVIDPIDTSRGSEPVIRGGDWNSIAVFCRSAFRIGNYPDFLLTRGFRVALVPVQ